MPIRRPDNPLRIATPQPAPGELELVAAFVNTFGREIEVDVLASAGGLAGWLIDRELLADGVELGEDERRRAVQVRQDLRSLIAARSGTKLNPEVIRRLRRATEASRFRLAFDDGGPAGFRPAASSFDDALGHLLAIVARARLEGRWQLFKLCARADCRRAFYDFSQNHRALYCTRRCADRERARAFRKTPKYVYRG